MTAARYQQLKTLGLIPVEEKEEFEQTLRWEKRSKAAKQAVETKRIRYTKWPSRRRDHALRFPLVP